MLDESPSFQPASLKPHPSKYNPHWMQKELKINFIKDGHTEVFKGDIFSLANNVWNGQQKNHFHLEVRVSEVYGDILKEYGLDAQRIAAITSQNENFSVPLLESAWRWLTAFYKFSTGLIASSKPWAPAPWLWAAHTAHDHLLLRKKPYPAFAAIRKAWKFAPLTLGSPAAERNFILSLLFPFAPVISCWLGKFFQDNYSSPNDPAQSAWAPISIIDDSVFSDFRAVRFSLEKGGWQWEIADSATFDSDPRGFFSRLPWVKKALGDRHWELKADNNGWRIYYI